MSKRQFILLAIILMTANVFAQITGKFGTYYDQRELLFEAMPTSEDDIIFLGNSITDGGEWCELFQNPNCKNRGISGDIISGVLNRLETITKGQPAMAFLMIGTNDMNWGMSNDSVALGVREVVQRIKQESPRTRIIVQSILPTNDCYGMFSGHTKRWQDVAIVNGMLKTMAEEEGVDYLDLYSQFANEEGKMDPAYSNDGLHINGDGYLLWKEIVETEIGKLPKPVRKSKVPIWLNMGAGMCFANCYDNGTIPFRYLGFGANLDCGVTVEWNRCHIQYEARGLACIMQHNIGYGYGIQSQTEFLYRCFDGKRNRLHLWAGGALQTYIDIKDLPPMMNASFGLSLFNNVLASSMVQYDFAFVDGGARNLFTAYGKISLPLIGYDIRPGFAYMDNYTGSNNVDDYFATTDGFLKAFSGLNADLGIYFNLYNGNRIGLSYRWDYLSTGKRGIHRYDNAFHAINLNFMFNLN